jgi:hypothetical protein
MRLPKTSWSSATRSWLLLIPSLPVFLMAAVVAGGPAEGLASTTSTPIGCTAAAARDLHVHLVNEAGAAPRTLDAARTEAGAIWASAGLRLTWSVPPVPFDVMNARTVIVVVRRSLLGRPAMDAADTHASHPPLGQLVFREDGRPGHLIEVSLEALTSLVMDGSQLERPIADLPDRARMPFLGRGLGRVVAHEIGHWLMGREHTRAGLMRASLGTRDLIDPGAAGLPRAWRAGAVVERLALSSRCERDVSHPGAREAAW